MSTGLMERVKQSLGRTETAVAVAEPAVEAEPRGVVTYTSDLERAMVQYGVLRMFNVVGIASGGEWTPEPRPVPEKPTTAMLRAMESPEFGDDARRQFAVQVEDLLGYTPLRKDAGAPSRLQRLLAALEIPAFDMKTVDEYREKMRAHHQAIADNRDREEDRQWGPSVIGYIRTMVSWSMVKLQDYSKPVPEYVLRKCVEIKQHAPDARFWVNELTENTRTIDPFLFVVLGKGRPDSEDVDAAAIEVWDEPEFEKTL